MVKFIFSGLLIFLFFGFQGERDRINWASSNQLVWKDFKGSPDKFGKNSAMAHTGIKTDFKYEEGVLEATVISYFRKDKSWVKKNFVNSKEGLKHEQGHFNITEIYARKLRKELLEQSFKLQQFQKDYKNIYEKHMDALNKAQEEYDKETNHHLNRDEQIKWDKKIDNDLKMLKDYHSSKLDLKVSQ